MEGVLAAFAQFDSGVRSDRTKAGMREALEWGRWTFPRAAWLFVVLLIGTPFTSP
jgi:DNA invertase Pin-like site-specific DNA recombinase